ncbi:MAG: hypothetical protein ACE5IJ_10600 [Thermoplasmata archaeon]
MKLIFELDKATLSFRQPFPFLDEDLGQLLVEKGFNEPEKGRNVLRVSPDGRESPAIRWERDEISVYYEPTRPFLTVEGKIPDGVAAAFDDILSVSRDLLGDTFKSEVRWAELNAIIRAVGSKSPLEAFRKYDWNPITAPLASILGSDVKPFRLSVYSAEDEDLNQPLSEVSDWIHVTVEPLVANPRYYFIRIVYRQSDVSSVSTFASRVEEIASKIISELEV